MKRENTEGRLAKIVGTIKGGIKNYAVDTSASLLYANTVFGAGEYFIGGMEPEEIMKTRLGMSLLGLVVYRPFGKFRDAWVKLLRTNQGSSKLRKFATDVSANIVFFAPIYTGVAYLAGASPDEIGASLSSGILTVTITGRPYGWFLDRWRKMFGVRPALDFIEEIETIKDEA